jgi:DNA polymerase-1
MAKRLFLLDGMALVYRAHFALIARPIFTSKGVNTSALYGFTQSLLEIINKHQPTHIGVAFDTDAPTQRHRDYADYKIQREAMPEELSAALPHVRRMLDAFNIPVIICDGYEADDLIGTLARRAEKEDFQTYIVSLDKDFGQLVNDKTFLFKVPRMGEGGEIMGVPEVLKRWSIQRTEQVADVLALMGDSSDNIPGVAGIGEKTAIKLVTQFGTVENLLAHTGELSGRVKENLEKFREDALLSKRLATIDCNAPCEVDLASLELRPFNGEKLTALLIEFEFNSLGRRLFGDDFKAGRGFQTGVPASGPAQTGLALEAAGPDAGATEAVAEVHEEKPVSAVALKKLGDVPHEYRIVKTKTERAKLIQALEALPSFCLHIETNGADAKDSKILGLAFSSQPHNGDYVPLPSSDVEAKAVLAEFQPLFENERIEKVGHNLKFGLSVLRWNGFVAGGKLFDTMVAHALIEPDMRHALAFLSEALLGYSPVPPTEAEEEKSGELDIRDVPVEKIAERATEAADLALQLRAVLEPMLKDKGQERVFYEIESPLIPVLVEMEFEGIKVDAVALAEFASQLAKEMDYLEKSLCQKAGRVFNINSPKQLGEVLFDVLKICEGAKKTKSGQYATDEQTLLSLAPDHEVVRQLLEYRTASKLKSTYADALPLSIWPRTSRVHTTFHQVATSTGRLNSQNPNLQNIPIRTERGQEIRKAFVPREGEYLLLSADYSQIELRIIAALSREAGLLEAFTTGVDVHTATAAKVYGVALDAVTFEMRRKAKMVNYGIAYGISAFGLAQRLGIPRREGAAIIDQYFKQFPGIRKYMEDTIAFARKHGYVETVTGRRRYIRDITSSNNTVRAGAERNAINAPIQGSAADMIKLAMIGIHRELTERKLKTRMLLQVHDELVFDLLISEENEVLPLVEEKMKTAIALDVLIVVEMGMGKNWLEAH